MPRIVIGFSKIEPIKMRGIVFNKYIPTGVYKRTQIHKNRISKALKGRVFSEEHKRKLTEAWKNIIIREKRIKGISEAKKGKKCPWAKPPVHKGKDNYLWKGEKVSYAGLHIWVRKWKGEAKICEYCGKKKTTQKSIQWANIDHKYRRRLKDFISLCAKCHIKHDKLLRHNKLLDL